MDYYNPDYAYNNWGQPKSLSYNSTEDLTHSELIELGYIEEEINEPDENHWSQLERLPF